ncbi:MAG: phosphohydrolase, partial [Burkholderiales bacterium]|nr:phosphohydrolase [Burkholderiales bacterium]
WPKSRVRAYFDWAKRVVDAMRGVHPRLEAIFDEAYGRKP